MLKDAARTKQIIVTTHNPEMVKHADLEDILLISRDRSGFSQVIRPGTKKEIRTFLNMRSGSRISSSRTSLGWNDPTPAFYLC